jgi:hypothetical protein
MNVHDIHEIQEHRAAPRARGLDAVPHGPRPTARLLRPESTEISAAIQHDRSDQQAPTPGHTTLVLTIAAVALVPVAFWGAIAWLLWGWLGAAVAAILVLVTAVFTVGLARAAGQSDRPSHASMIPAWDPAA